MAIVPFNVPESFSPSGNESLNFGRELAARFHQELMGEGELGIIELFNRDRWPGKRSEFNAGNYGSIELARNAGYDLVLVGYLEEIVNETDLTLLTKVIDTSNGVTVWYGRTVAYSSRRPLRRTLAEHSFGFVKDEPDSFRFQERADEMARCTVDSILHGDIVLPDGGTEPGWYDRIMQSVSY
jgi:hypothetical protein